MRVGDRVGGVGHRLQDHGFLPSGAPASHAYQLLLRALARLPHIVTLHARATFFNDD